MSKLRYYLRIAKWMVIHRHEPNNRQKWRRLQRELPSAGPTRR